MIDKVRSIISSPFLRYITSLNNHRKSDLNYFFNREERIGEKRIDGMPVESMLPDKHSRLNQQPQDSSSINYLSWKHELKTMKETPHVIAIGPSWLLLLKPSTWHCNRLPNDSLPFDLSRVDLTCLTQVNREMYEAKLLKRIQTQIETDQVQGMHEFAKNIYAYFLVTSGRFPRCVKTYPSSAKWVEGCDNVFEDKQTDSGTAVKKTAKNNYICAMVHRLDLETSGVLLFATTVTSQMILRGAFRNRLMEKSYTVLVHGVTADRGVCDLPLLTQSDGCPQRRYRGDGKTHGSHFTRCAEDGEIGSMEARSEWELLRIYKLRRPDQILRMEGYNSQRIEKILKERDHRKVEDMKERRASGVKDTSPDKSPWSQYVSLVKVKIVTGRTHQIRVHMGHLGYPVVGDIKYLPSSIAYTDRIWCPRQWLHSSELVFIDPDRVDKNVLASIEQDANISKQLKKLKARVPLCDDIASALLKGCILVEERRPLGAEISLPSPYAPNRPQTNSWAAATSRNNK